MMELKQAVEIAGLWKAGKMIGYNEDEVMAALYDGIIVLERELENQWLQNHDERCANLHDCSSFNDAGNKCREPRPKILESIHE